MRTVIVTVGTSLLTNAQRDAGKSPLTGADLMAYLHRMPAEKASAETNSLTRILTPDDRMVFLHSQTDEGKRCAEVLVQYYRQAGYDADLREVPDLTYAERRFKNRGLRSLVSTLIGLIDQERRAGRDVVINATGGFKAEVAYATLVGVLLDVPVYYIHEAFGDIIEMPSLPIAWDYSLLADHEDFFTWIRSDLRRTREVERRLSRIPDCSNEVRLLLEAEEGFTTLSAAGEAFYEAYQISEQRYAGVPVYLSPNAQACLEGADPTVRSEFEKVLIKLRDPLLRRTGSGQVNNCDCFVYPRGKRNERSFWFEEDGVVYVCELARHSDESYERLIRRGVWRADYKDFRPWQPAPA